MLSLGHNRYKPEVSHNLVISYQPLNKLMKMTSLLCCNYQMICWWHQVGQLGAKSSTGSVITKCPLPHLPLDKMAAILADDIFKCIFMNKNYRIPNKIALKFFPWVQLTMNQHWFRQWLGAEHATSHYLNQCWPSLLTYMQHSGEMS